MTSLKIQSSNDNIAESKVSLVQWKGEKPRGEDWDWLIPLPTESLDEGASVEEEMIRVDDGESSQSGRRAGMHGVRMETESYMTERIQCEETRFED